MKTNKFLRIASVLLIAVLLSTCVISGTFAKYVSTFEGQDSARVAKWQFEINNVDVSASNNFAFDLFDTIKDTDGAAEENVDDTETIIAPGTSGSFAIAVENLSEVDAKVKFDFTVTNANIPLEFSINGTDGWTADINAFDAEVAEVDMLNGTASKTIYWRWVFERGEDDELITNDGADTTLGLAGTATAVVNAKVTATQID